MKKVIFFIIILLTLTSCAEKKRIIQKTQMGKPPGKIAILPSENISNDILGGFVLRNITYQKLQQNSKNFEIQDIATTDSLLISEGISDGGLLKLFSPNELCQILAVDGLLYIDIYSMGMKITPFYHSRYIDSQYRLYNFSDLVWQKPINIANRVVDFEGAINAISNIAKGNIGEAFGDAAGQMIVQGLVKLGTATLFDHELKPEMIMVADTLLINLPYGQKNSIEYIESVNKKLEFLNDLRDKKRPLIFGDEKEIELEEVQIIEDGLNIIN